MALKAYKRPALATAAEPISKKPAIEDPILVHCHTVCNALAKAVDYPGSVRSMLEAMATSALSSAKEERHPFQAKVADMVGEVLDSIESQAKDVVAELQGKVDGCSDDKVCRQAALSAAEQSIAVLKDATSKQATTLDTESAALEAAQKELAAAAKIQAEGDTQLKEAEEKKSALGAAQESFRLAKEGPANKATMKTLASIGKDFKFDAALMETLPFVLKKEPALRAGFDLVALEQLEAALSAALAELDKVIEEGAPSKADRDAAVAAAQATCYQAAAKHAAAQEAFSTAQKLEQEGKDKLAHAKEAVANFLPDAKALMDDYDNKKALLLQLSQGPIAAFKELQTRTLPSVLAPAATAEAEVEGQAEGEAA
uniref:Uncharacterized protein n=1 Tax=Pyrodinium bahamense TaxID=73915 RepID=A0A7S0AIS4_9DINO|mmetsp:Transcript_35557/g.98423  ORF Transcript_35557/g.98423 Transcript_35557/m.98423 type:complete len:371 (+) Transcript_35557:49-1161(+)